MAVNFKIAGSPAANVYQVDTMAVASGSAASISVGDMVTVASGYAAKSANNAATSAGQFGVALSVSTDTASAAGTVVVAYSPAGLRITCLAKTPASLAQSVVYTGCKLYVTGAVQKVDQSNAGKIMIVAYDDTTNGNVTCLLPWSLA